jgi:hypothetical protein
MAVYAAPMLHVRVATVAVSLLALFLVSSCKSVSPDALPATEAWLALVDSGQYAESWGEAASFFKAAVDSPNWERQVAGVRGPLGKMQSRVVKSATSVPGAPDGEYVIFQFDTSFEHKTGAVETVTPMKDKDGRWRVSGYYIR